MAKVVGCHASEPQLASIAPGFARVLERLAWGLYPAVDGLGDILEE